MVVVEVAAPGAAPVRVRTNARRISIGRAFQNDIVVDDPYVDPHHLVLTYSAENGGWRARDLSTKNGTRVGADELDGVAVDVPSDRTLTIGRTKIRVLSVDQEVEPAKSLRDLEHRLLALGRPAVVATLFAAAVAIASATDYAAVWTKIKPIDVFNSVATWSGLLVAVAGGLALFSRLLRGEPRFLPLLAIGSLETAITWPASFAFDVLEYNLPDAPFREAVRYLVELGIACVFFYATLRLITRLRSGTAAMVCAAILVSVSAVYFVNDMDDAADAFIVEGRYDKRLLAPPFRLNSGETLESFRAGAEVLFDDADAAAAEQDE